MMGLMYDIPSRDDVSEVIITKEFAMHQGDPKLKLKETTAS